MEHISLLWTNGGMDMLWANLFWVWGHPEVYILILPAFGIYSEIISTFSSRNLYGYKSMVASMVIISVLSFLVWTHHFFTMGQGALSNSFSRLQRWRLPFQPGLRYLTGYSRCGKGKFALLFQCFIQSGLSHFSLSVGLQGLCLRCQLLTINTIIQCS